jgi:hypothetical protein
MATPGSDQGILERIVRIRERAEHAVAVRVQLGTIGRHEIVEPGRFIRFRCHERQHTNRAIVRPASTDKSGGSTRYVCAVRSSHAVAQRGSRAVDEYVDVTAPEAERLRHVLARALLEQP